MSSSSDVEMEENREEDNEENRREGREESSKRERRTTTRVDDDVEMTTVETIAKTTAREDFKAFKKSNKSILEEFQSKQKERERYEETAAHYKKHLNRLVILKTETISKIPNSFPKTDYLERVVDFLHEAIPLLERAEKEEGAARKASGEEFIGIVNVSDDDEEVQKKKGEEAWNKVGRLANGELDEKVYTDKPREKRSPKKANAENTDHHGHAERVEKVHEKDNNDGWNRGNGGVSRTKTYSRKKNPTNIGPVNGRGASMVEAARLGFSSNKRATSTPRSAPRAVSPRHEIEHFCPEQFIPSAEKRPKTRNDVGGSGHKVKERMFGVRIDDLEEDDPIEDVQRIGDNSRGNRPRGRGRETREKKEPIVVDLVDSEDDASNKPIEIDSPIQQRRRTTRQNAGFVGSSVARFGKFTATYPNDGSKGAALINTNDLDCLEPGEMLNDQTIDFYMKKIAVEDFPSLEDKGRCLVMSTYFYQKLTQKSRGASNIAERKDQAYERVKNWTKSINIFEKDFILIPIHAQLHWSLAIISYPGLAANSAERVEMGNIPCIIHLDSMGTNSSHAFESIRKNLTQWLQREYNRVESERTGGLVEDGATRINNETMRKLNPIVPLQTNGCDCGVFTLLYAQKFIQNLPKEFTLADFDSILYGKVNTRISFQKLSLHEPYRLLTPRMLDMDKFIEQSWKEEIRKRYGSSEKEEVKEEVKEEENNISLHIVGEKEEEEEEVNDLRDEEDEDVKHFKSKMQPSPEEEEGEKNSENKENDLKSSEEVAIISETDGKSGREKEKKREEKKEEQETRMSIEKILQTFPKTWIQTNCPEMFRETWFPPMECAEQMRVRISLMILEALQEKMISKYKEFEAMQNALPESEKENEENAVVKNFKNVTQLVPMFSDAVDENATSLSALDRNVCEAKLKMERSEKRRINECLQKIFTAREKEDENVQRLNKHLELREERKRQKTGELSDDDDAVRIIGYKSKPGKQVQTTLQRSGDETNLFERGRTIWKDGIQPPPRRGEQAKTRAPSPPRTRGTLNDSNDIAKKMRRSHNARDQSSNQETMRDARIRLLTQKPAREQTPPEKKAGLVGSIVDRFKRRDKES